MTVRQKILSLLYKFYRNSTLVFQKRVGHTSKNIEAPDSFYSLSATLNNGNIFSFEQLRGKKVIIANTASDCIYTAQYEELQKLYESHHHELMIIAFPSNEFKEQEKKNDDAIAEFCQVNYGITFPLMQKSFVLKGTHQHEVYQWLTDKNKNGWNERQPAWNFFKYVIDENGQLTNYFGSSVSPFSLIVF